MTTSDIEYKEWLEYPYLRLRVEIDKQDGIPTRFVVQLEYKLEDEWMEIARFDHNKNNGHDITDEGLHMDLYKDGEKYDVIRDFPHVPSAIPLSDAPQYCIMYIKKNLDKFVQRFEKWHNVEKDN